MSIEPELVSEPIKITEFDTSAMKAGLAGAPRAFVWRDRECVVAEVLDRRKFSRGDAHNPVREKYLKREYFTVRLETGQVAELYIERQPRPGASENARKQRWFLYTISRPSGDGSVDRA
jgi:hypothetical protein